MLVDNAQKCQNPESASNPVKRFAAPLYCSLARCEKALSSRQASLRNTSLRFVT
ncbi:hypothetical protein ApDm4_0434 [Acetobacter pomorum]|nr:hypothetical protein ApDm4_0434 [Acetobacter pomorum]